MIKKLKPLFEEFKFSYHFIDDFESFYQEVEKLGQDLMNLHINTQGDSQNAIMGKVLEIKNRIDELFVIINMKRLRSIEELQEERTERKIRAELIKRGRR